MDKMKLLALGQKFIIKEYDENEYEIQHKESKICAYIHTITKNVDYYVTGIYNNSSDKEEICIEDIKELEEFCNLMLEEK